MAYWWLNIIIAITAGLVTVAVLNGIIKTKRLTFSLSVIGVIVLALLVSYFYITPYYKVSTFERQLKHQPVFALIAEQEPALFRSFLVSMRPFILKQKQPIQIRLAAEKLEQQVFTRALRKATDETIINYLTAKQKLYNQLLSQNPQLILHFEFPNKFPAIDIHSLDASTFQAELHEVNNTKAKIIESAVKTPQAIPERFEVKYLINLVNSRLSTKYGKANVKMLFTQPDDPNLKPELGAKIIIDYYQQVLRLGTANASKVIRYTANKSQ